MKKLISRIWLLALLAAFAVAPSRAQGTDAYDDSYGYGWGDGIDQQQWWNPADWYDSTYSSSDYDYDWNDYNWYGDYDYDYDYGANNNWNTSYPPYGDHEYGDTDYGYEYDYGNDEWYDSYDYDYDYDY